MRAILERPDEPEGHRRGRLYLERDVREHVLHQRLLKQSLTEGSAMIRVMDGLRERLAHQAAAGHHTVDAGVLDHLDDGADATAGLSNPGRPCAHILNLT